MVKGFFMFLVPETKQAKSSCGIRVSGLLRRRSKNNSQRKKIYLVPMSRVKALDAHTAPFVKALSPLGGSGELHLMSTEFAVGATGSFVKRLARFTAAPSSVDKQPDYGTNTTFGCRA